MLNLFISLPYHIHTCKHSLQPRLLLQKCKVKKEQNREGKGSSNDTIKSQNHTTGKTQFLMLTAKPDRHDPSSAAGQDVTELGGLS